MIIFFILLWLIDRYAWKYTKVLGKIEQDHDFDFVNKYSQASGPKINVNKLRSLATASSSVRLFEVSDQDMAQSLESMTRSKVAKKTQIIAKSMQGTNTTCIAKRTPGLQII